MELVQRVEGGDHGLVEEALQPESECHYSENRRQGLGWSGATLTLS